jgi:U4/U6 small nuclear ribonucleoprotein PRP31
VQNETDLTLVELGGILPSAQIMSVTVTASTTPGKPLSADALADVLAACDEFIALEGVKATLLAFIESRMAAVAPNVSSLLGTRVAALLVGIAGGVTALSRIPSCNVQVRARVRGTPRAVAGGGGGGGKGQDMPPSPLPPL